MKEKKLSDELKYCLQGSCGDCNSYSVGIVIMCPDLLEKAYETMQEYESTGLLPEQLKEIDKLYAEKCEEVAKLQKELKRYRDLEGQCIAENAVGIEVMLRKFAEFKADMNELCEYKELEEQRKLIKLAWAVGDTYFKIKTALWRNQVKEIIMGQTKNDFDGFKEAMKPAVEWLQKNGNPHQRIIIELDGVELLSGEMAFSVEVPD